VINKLSVALEDFKFSIQPFSKPKVKLGQVLLAFENKFLSIESGDIKVVMNANGEWHGRATFSPVILRALATVPPSIDPLVFEFKADYLKIGTIKIPCDWQITSATFIRNLENPSLLDLLALEKTMLRVEMRGSGLGKDVRNAKRRAESKVKNAADQLEELEISEADIWQLLEIKLAHKIKLL
jgi:hypothetical protein